jgi:outer membrane protein assembly factor BamD
MSTSTPFMTAASRARLGLLLVAAIFLLPALAVPQENAFSRIKAKLSHKEKKLPPAEEVFQRAEELYNGKETWLGKLVRKTAGEDSKLYKTGHGIKRKNEAKAAELYQQVVDNYPFSKYAPIASLRLADCQYALENYEEARLYYEQFLKAHPQSEDAPYALFRDGMCHYQQKAKVGRDPDETRQAAAIFTDFLARYPQDPRASEATEKLRDCRDRLAKYELLVADFYFHHREYWAAAARYRGVWQVYSGLGYDGRAMFQEAVCYQSMGKLDRAVPLYNKLIETWPNDEYAAKARERIDAIGREPSP